MVKLLQNLTTFRYMLDFEFCSCRRMSSLVNFFPNWKKTKIAFYTTTKTNGLYGTPLSDLTTKVSLLLTFVTCTVAGCHENFQLRLISACHRLLLSIIARYPPANLIYWASEFVPLFAEMMLYFFSVRQLINSELDNDIERETLGNSPAAPVSKSPGWTGSIESWTLSSSGCYPVWLARAGPH